MTYRLGAGMLGRTRLFRAVDDVSFSIDAGKVYGLVGESGSGKSTVARLVLGLSRPSGGEVRFQGEDISSVTPARWKELRREMQMVFQDPMSALDPRMPVLDQVVEPLTIHRIGAAAERVAGAEAMLASVGIGLELHGRFPHQLSGGQRQRVVIARALILSPRLLVCDEPVSALDVSIQAQVINLLADLRTRLGVGYLFISHDLRVVRHIADDIGVMHKGCLVETGPAENIFRHPQHAYTRALLAASPDLVPRRCQKGPIAPGVSAGQPAGHRSDCTAISSARL
ncbi:ATP-binding cassette domain-containing protein [Pikeienuella piscinae]|nr:ATP-binding cassette domain-containing protein [Pikeienuella piscinae]